MKKVTISYAMLLSMLLIGGTTLSWAENQPGSLDTNSAYSGHKHACKGDQKADNWQAKREARKKEFAKKLDLSQEQQAKIDAIHETFHQAHKPEFDAMKTQWKELREMKKNGATKEAIEAKKASLKPAKEKMKVERQEIDQQIEAVLTPVQVTKWKAMKEEHKKKFEQHKGTRHSGGKKATS